MAIPAYQRADSSGSPDIRINPRATSGGTRTCFHLRYRLNMKVDLIAPPRRIGRLAGLCLPWLAGQPRESGTSTFDNHLTTEGRSGDRLPP